MTRYGQNDPHLNSYEAYSDEKAVHFDHCIIVRA